MTLLVDIQRRTMTPDAYPVIGESCPVTVEAAGDEDIPSGNLLVTLRFGPVLLEEVTLTDFAGTLDLTGDDPADVWEAAGNPYSAAGTLSLVDTTAGSPTVWATAETTILRKPWSA